MSTRKKNVQPAAQTAPMAAEPKNDDAPAAGQGAPDTTTAGAAAAPQGARADAAALGQELSDALEKAGSDSAVIIPAGQELQETETEALFVRTKARAGSRRRAGHVFTPEPYGIALNALTEEQIAAIEGDPLLVVERTIVPADE